MERNIKLSLEKAKELFGKDPIMDEIILANFTKEELKDNVKQWSDLGTIDRWWVDDCCDITWDTEVDCFDSAKSLFATRNQAQGFGIAMAMLSQLMKEKRNGWVPDWPNRAQSKFCIVKGNAWGLHIECFQDIRHALSFQDSASAEEFLSDHLSLIESYFKAVEQ